MNIEQLKNELKALGFTEEKLNQLLDLAVQEALDTALNDLEANVDDETMQHLADAMQTPPTDVTDATNRLNMVFEKAYGMNAENKKTELIASYLQSTITDTKAAKELFDRYQAGDPTAIAKVKSQEGNPDAQQVANMM